MLMRVFFWSQIISVTSYTLPEARQPQINRALNSMEVIITDNYFLMVHWLINFNGVLPVTVIASLPSIWGINVYQAGIIASEEMS